MRLNDPSLEKLAIKTIASGSKVGSLVLGRIRKDHFVYEPAVECFDRMSSVLRDRGKVLAWGELIHDPIISEDTRKMMRAYDRPPLTTLDHGVILANNLNNYRKLRKIFDAVKLANDSFRADRINPDKLLEGIGTLLTEARHSISLDDSFTHIGIDDNSRSLVRGILKGSGQTFIPTGFAAFDSSNVGLPIGGLTMLAATTGGGKSAMALQLAINMAKWGARVCTVPLEMNRAEVMMRRMANVANVDLSDLIKLSIHPDSMAFREKQRIDNAMAAYGMELRKKNTVETYFNPPADMTMEEILHSLQPYGYQVIIIDYVGLLKGVDGDDQWQKLGAAARFAKVFAEHTGTNVIICAQLSAEGFVRYSRAMVEHANNAWTWVYDENAAQSHILNIDQAKARNQKKFRFPLVEDFAHMTIRDLNQDERATFGNDAGPSETAPEGGRKQYRIKTVTGGGGNRMIGGGGAVALDEYYGQ